MMMMEWREIRRFGRACVCAAAWTFAVSSLCLFPCACPRERKNERPPPLLHTCSCNPRCFGDLGNLVTKHSWCPFDWGHGWAWSLDRVKRRAAGRRRRRIKFLVPSSLAALPIQLFAPVHQYVCVSPFHITSLATCSLNVTDLALY